MRDVMVSTAVPWRFPRSARTGGVPSPSVSGQHGAADTSETPTIIRGACILLMITGFVSVMFSLPVMLNAGTARCRLSRTFIDQANKDKKDWNNVDTGGQKAKDLACPDVIRLADQIKLQEKGTKTASVPSESTLKLQNAVAVLMGLGQGAAGVLLLRSMGRGARNAALAFSAFGIVLQILGIFSLLVFAFVVYAFLFSAASRELWPKEPRDHTP
jgi:hypothetical protein